jgi:hypothetical protein
MATPGNTYLLRLLFRGALVFWRCSPADLPLNSTPLPGPRPTLKVDMVPTWAPRHSPVAGTV